MWISAPMTLNSASASVQWKVFAATCLIAFCLLGKPEANSIRPKYDKLRSNLISWLTRNGKIATENNKDRILGKVK